MNIKKWINKVLITLLISMLAISIASASALSDAKAAGYIGEQPNGYLGLVNKSTPPDIKQLIAEVNAKRKAGYQKIADKQGASLTDVELVGGKTAMDKTVAGNYIQRADGSWQKK